MTKPDPIDVHVGSRVRKRRTLLKLTQEDLAKALGLTFQQIQKYEKGKNRIGAGRLYKISNLLEVPVSYFFQGLAGVVDEREGKAKNSLDLDVLSRRQTLEMVRAYYQIRDKKLRKKAFEFIKAMGKTFSGNE